MYVPFIIRAYCKLFFEEIYGDGDVINIRHPECSDDLSVFSQIQGETIIIKIVTVVVTPACNGEIGYIRQLHFK